LPDSIEEIETGRPRQETMFREPSMFETLRERKVARDKNFHPSKTKG
jgi:hypothetical protein